MSPLARAAVALAAAALVLALLVRAGRLADRRPPAERARKPRLTPVALAGGPAILAALMAWELLGGPFLVPVPALGPWAAGGLAPLGADGGELPWAAVLAAFAVGWIDDLRGLSAAAKLGGQVATGFLLALERSPGPLEGLLCVLVVVVALNAWNVLDHADGTASLPCALFMTPLPGAWLGVLAFLPSNLLLRRGRERVPLAYLGDSGSHLLGLLLVLSPWAPWVFVVPLADLVRVALLRRREGRAVWEGDRRHLGHRLEAAGLGPLAAAGVSTLLFTPALVTLAGPRPGALLLGLLLPLAAFLGAMRGSPDPSGQGGSARACPRAGPER